MRYALCLILAACLSTAAPSQPPPPFSVEIASPANFGATTSPVLVSGSAGILNGIDAVTVELFNSEGASIGRQKVNTNATGQWLANFGPRPVGLYGATASVATGESDSVIFAVTP